MGIAASSSRCRSPPPPPLPRVPGAKCAFLQGYRTYQAPPQELHPAFEPLAPDCNDAVTDLLHELHRRAASFARATIGL